MNAAGLSSFVGGVIRAMAPAIIAWLVARNVTSEVASDLVQYLADGVVAVITLGAAIWSIRGKLQRNKVADVIARPEVRSIELSPELAETVRTSAPKFADKIIIAEPAAIIP